MTYSHERPKTTTCNRCGETVKYRHGVEPEYCGDCEQVIQRRSVR